MLERIDFSVSPMDKELYKSRRDAALDKLVVLQQRAHAAGIGLAVLFEGWNGAGKGSRISDLMYKLDARFASVYVTPDLDTESLRDFAGTREGVEGLYPDMQEFWRALGARGTTTIYDRGWYTRAAQRMLFAGERPRKIEDADLAQYLTEAANFERQLTADGYIVVKFFFHMTKKGQKKRLRKLAENPATAWRVSNKKLKSIENYDTAYKFYDRLLEGSSLAAAPWRVLNGEDKRRTNLAIVETLVQKIEERLAEMEATGVDLSSQGVQRPVDQAGAEAPADSRFPIVAGYPRVDAIDHTLAIPEAPYKQLLKAEQHRLFELEAEMYCRRVPLMVMFEGWDAAGKGGAIKRVAQALDARAYTIFPSPAPTKPELMHPHLWRYWTRLPKAGHVGIYDRSWYGRVLVERVEGFASPEQWGRAYDEINEFEEELIDWGAILVKFWVDVSQDEQLRRFEDRQNDPAKQWKITEEDWRNREKYPAYKKAVNDMFRLTSTTFAPWTVLESEDKRYARVKALRTINEALEARLRG